MKISKTELLREAIRKVAVCDNTVSKKEGFKDNYTISFINPTGKYPDRVFTFSNLDDFVNEICIAIPKSNTEHIRLHMKEILELLEIDKEKEFKIEVAPKDQSNH